MEMIDKALEIDADKTNVLEIKKKFEGTKIINLNKKIVIIAILRKMMRSICVMPRKIDFSVIDSYVTFLLFIVQ